MLTWGNVLINNTSTTIQHLCMTFACKYCTKQLSVSSCGHQLFAPACEIFVAGGLQWQYDWTLNKQLTCGCITATKFIWWKDTPKTISSVMMKIIFKSYDVILGIH